MAVADERKTYNVVSLFSGCGGADQGFQGDFRYLGKSFERLPFTTSWANDVDHFAAKVYRHNLTGEVSEMDVARVKFETLELAETDVLVAGFPCQDFAMLGPRGGLQSKRGQMYKQVRRALRVLRPKVFVVENVPGIEHPPTILKTILRGLTGRKEPFYRIQVYRINVADYGVPQLRSRLMLIGIRSDLKADFLPPEPAWASLDAKTAPAVETWLTAQEALDDLWCGKGPESSPVADQRKVTHATIVLDKPKRRDKRLEAGHPSPTIRAEHHGHVELHYRRQDDGSLRRLTVRECARLQGFPDSFTFPVTFTQAYRQIGNAIPPVLMHHWAKSILAWLQAIDGTGETNGRRPTSHRDPRVTSKIMATVKSRDSKAELALGKAMWQAGLRYRKHPKGIAGKPDYAFLRKRVAVFCDGDFWHGHGWRERGFTSWEQQFERIRNGAFWREKIQRNVERDKEVNSQLLSAGWTVLRFRESEIRGDAALCAVTVRNTLSRTGLLAQRSPATEPLAKRGG